MGGQLEKSTGITGATDSTDIGNVGDRLKVTADITSAPIAINTSYSKTLRFVDMGVASGGVARGSSITVAAGWVDVFNYTGSGILSSFMLNLATDTNWFIRLLIDGADIFGSAGISTSDMVSASIYNLDSSSNVQTNFGISMNLGDRFFFSGPLNFPIYYATSVVVKVSRAASTQQFQAGIVILSKET